MTAGPVATAARKRLAVAVAAVAVLLLAACGGAGSLRIPVPDLAAGSRVEMRVAIADNPRLPAMDPSAIDRMLVAASRTASRHFAIDVRFAAPERVSLDKLFAGIPEPVRQAQGSAIYDHRPGRGDRPRLQAGIARTLAGSGSSLADMVAFAAPHAPGIAGGSVEELAAGLADVLVDRLARWRTLTARDGRPVLDGSPFSEWAYWDSLGYGELPYELVITNQLVASAEYYGADVHSSIRGGATVGTTSFSRQSRHRAFVMWSTFPYLDDSPATTALRAGERYTADEAAELAGIYLAHELGHYLLHLGHPFDQPACIMNPVPMFHFRAAAAALDPDRCRVGSTPEMTPGAAAITYRPAWAGDAGGPARR